jgi:hypothetical protein
VPNRWEVRLAGAAGLTHFREKAGPAGQVRCEDPGGYSAPVALAGQDLAARAVGQEEGPHQLCILGGAGPSLDDWWQAPAFALPIVTYVDSTPPSQRPSFRTFVSEEAVATEPIFKLPELAGFSYVFGPASELDCSQPDLRWEPYRRFFIEIPSSVFPARLCVRAEDLAGNVGAPLGFEYP